MRTKIKGEFSKETGYIWIRFFDTFEMCEGKNFFKPEEAIDYLKALVDGLRQWKDPNKSLPKSVLDFLKEMGVLKQ